MKEGGLENNQLFPVNFMKFSHEPFVKKNNIQKNLFSEKLVITKIKKKWPGS